MFAYYASHEAILHSVINMDVDMAPCLHISHFKFIIPLLEDTDLDMAPCLHITA